jgi:hypothetical protein
MKNKRPEFGTRIITPIFRLSYPHVWESTYNQLAKRDEYSIQMLFEKATAKASMAEMAALVKKLKDWKGWTTMAGIKTPFIDGDTKLDSAGVPYAEKNPAFKGMILVRSWSKQAPGIVDPTGKHPITQHDEIYGGCWCRAQLNAYAYEQAGNKGIGFGLLHLQKIKDGEPFGNRTRPEDAFSPVENTEEAPSADDPMFS